MLSKGDVWNPVQQKTTLMQWKISLPKINEFQVIEEFHCTEEKEESDQDSSISEDTPVEDYPIENIKAFFEVKEVDTHLPQYSADCYNLIDIQDARMCKTKPARGNKHTSGASCITSGLINDIEAKVTLDTGHFALVWAKIISKLYFLNGKTIYYQ
ncbi:hypothetical protein O181_132180 [Austropuccinia psidii MF-1]|uniref:Uncharacterized protein n=1 Tax=Austropuccinia psidii MF-1 TaxID=1389203 RepID=A0A9Q3L6I8_9BASI|nr:hypothetical protein [Austropuccinia psidii MF-1]